MGGTNSSHLRLGKVFLNLDLCAAPHHGNKILALRAVHDAKGASPILKYELKLTGIKK
jgi:hypothetical protein